MIKSILTINSLSSRIYLHTVQTVSQASHKGTQILVKLLHDILQNSCNIDPNTKIIGVIPLENNMITEGE